MTAYRLQLARKSGTPCFRVLTPSRIWHWLEAMDLSEINRLGAKLSSLLDQYVDDSGMWVDIPWPAYTDPETGISPCFEEGHPEGLTCAFCKCQYCPLLQASGIWGAVCVFSAWQLCLDTQGYRDWNVCSDECEAALERQFKARSKHSMAELRELKKARSLLKETRLFIRRGEVNDRKSK